MFKILGISGKKQSGKNTMANYIQGTILRGLDMVQDFSIIEGGHLSVLTSSQDGTSGWGIFDTNRNDTQFVEYAHHHLWPHVKMYSFAGGLKSICVEFFGLTPEQVYGTDEQKNTETHMLWKDMPSTSDSRWMVNAGANRSPNMTAREFMQYFGTDIMRRMYEPVHVNHTINRILSEQSELAIVPDVRFPNEVKAIQDVGGKVVRLARDTKEDSHSSECCLDEDNFDWNNFDAVVHNTGSLDNSLRDFGKSCSSFFLG
jgi:hypothetical protein